ncbi:MULTISPECIES: BMP family protein [Pyrobaculum]|uniref:Nucleoside-binding protein n=2 Tax=Pyrobaculum arsenaticum TaxID=121277 RepID=A4WL77_PYRAR|nr:BMP family ABC transporter substrate-binding protein [Pyrobaculum arsenaticum]ABP51144.1 nucleoside-binding protein [Pyrobaculum arsenaticum DSM 13514]MCY0891619.1 BMP family ABC transporter substrate-binding protein [Pyrobaculum arsenaticum]NYR15132.1 BMP family ABC transporter substrate-binding protein [Pyrobaculum arsenaticum]
MNTKLLVALVVVIIAVAAAALLLLQQPQQASTQTTQTPSKGNIYVIYDIGGRGDLSFNDMAYLGASKAAKDFGLGLKEVQSKTQDDYVPNLRAAARSGDAALVVAVGFLMTDAVKQVSQEYPNAKFAIIDGYIPDRPNVLSVLYRENEGSALVGALAALTAYHFNCTKVGIVLGMEIPVLWKFEIGYAYGVRWAERYLSQKFGKNVKFDVLYIYTGSFNDPAKGKQAAEVMLAQGVCVIYQAAGATGLGVFEAVAEAGKKAGRNMGPPFAIGVDADQDYLKPGFILASMMKRVDVGVYTAAKMAVEGNFKGGVLELGLKEGGVSVSTLSDLRQFIEIGVSAGAVRREDADKIVATVSDMRSKIPSWIWEAVDQLKQDIIAGREKVPLPTAQDQVVQLRKELGLGVAG